MKVLWHTNIILPIFAKALNQKPSVYGGWMTGFIESLVHDQFIQLVVCFPASSKVVKNGNVDGIDYYAIPAKFYKKKDRKLSSIYQTILRQENPDILHVYGTEFPHTLLLIQTFNQPDRTVINLQGIVSKISEIYTYGLPDQVIHRYTFRDIIRHMNIYKQQQDYKKRGLLEKKAISLSKHVIGRTSFDFIASKEMNSDVTYHKLNENLRTVFYKHKWDINHIDRFSIFMSQSHDPFKGLHLIIPAFSEIIKIFPDSKLLIAGKKPFDDESIISKIKIDSYGLYIKKLLKKFNVYSKVVFLGELDEEKMCKSFLNAHVFLSSSTIENESNSVSEAKILGVPTVSSEVGGVTSRITHQVDGLFYPLSQPNQMVNLISSIFADDQLALRLSVEAQHRAINLFDKEKNIQKLREIYNSIYK